ncbi:MAG: restriction endonuclease [Candidatus Omnitrophota bacterium]
MTEKEIVIWGIHAGRTGDADNLFQKKNVVALGWEEMGDLSKHKDRESFKKALVEVYPEAKPGAIANYAGQLYRFIYEMKKEDMIIYPSKRDREVHIGVIEGEYRYDARHEDGYPNIREVKWIKSLPRTAFTQGALYEIGSAMSFFQVKNYADEFKSKVESKTVPSVVAKDETVEMVTQEIAETARDFILKKLSQELKGHPFADFVAHLLGKMGYRTRVSPEGPDGGIDIIAHKDELGFEPPIIKVQVKSTGGTIGDPEVSSLYGKVGSNEFGLFVTLGFFSNQSRNFAKSKSNLRLIDGNELVDLILEHYESFDSGYKGLIPLKKVYLPETFED